MKLGSTSWSNSSSEHEQLGTSAFKVVGLFRIGIKTIDEARAFGFGRRAKLSQRPNEVE